MILCRLLFFLLTLFIVICILHQLQVFRVTVIIYCFLMFLANSYGHILLLKKSQVASLFKPFHALIKTRFERNIKTFQCVNGTEYINGPSQKFFLTIMVCNSAYHALIPHHKMEKPNDISNP